MKAMPFKIPKLDNNAIRIQVDKWECLIINCIFTLNFKLHQSAPMKGVRQRLNLVLAHTFTRLLKPVSIDENVEFHMYGHRCKKSLPHHFVL